MADDNTNLVDSKAVDGIALMLVKGYDMASQALGSTLPADQRLKPLNSPEFLGADGQFDRQKFNAYVHSRAEEIYEGKTEFAKEVTQKLYSAVPAMEGLPTTDKYGSLLKAVVGDNPTASTESLKDKASPFAQTMAEYSDPMPLGLSGLVKGVLKMFGVDLPFEPSGKMTMKMIMGLFTHGFPPDFDAIKKDVMKDFADDVAAKMKPPPTDKEGFRNTVAEILDTQTKAQSGPNAAETYENTKLNAFTDTVVQQINGLTNQPGHNNNVASVPSTNSTRTADLGQLSAPAVPKMTGFNSVNSQAKTNNPPAQTGGAGTADKLKATVTDLFNKTLASSPLNDGEKQTALSAGVPVATQVIMQNADAVKSGDTEAVATAVASASMRDPTLHQLIKSKVPGFISDEMIEGKIKNNLKDALTPAVMAQLQAGFVTGISGGQTVTNTTFANVPNLNGATAGR